MNMKRKILFSFIIIFLFFSLTFSFYYFTERKEILKKEVSTNLSQALVINKPEKMESYQVRYKGKDIFIYKYVFPNQNVANSFFGEFLNNLKEQNKQQQLRKEEEIFINQTQMEIDGYSGIKGVFLKPEKRFSVIIGKDNFVIISNSANENSLNKVIKWFIKKQF
jgi:hypothetical protein